MTNKALLNHRHVGVDTTSPVIHSNVPGSFRLVELHAGKLGSEVQCSLIHSFWANATYGVSPSSFFSKDIGLSDQVFQVAEIYTLP